MKRGYVNLLGSPMGCRPITFLNQEIGTFIVHRKIEEPRLSGESLHKEILHYYSVDCSRRAQFFENKDLPQALYEKERWAAMDHRISVSETLS